MAFAGQTGNESSSASKGLPEQMLPFATPQKNDLKPWLKEEWCLPTVSPEFVWRMEDVLDLYAEAYDPAYPVVCFDESP